MLTLTVSARVCVCVNSFASTILPLAQAWQNKHFLVFCGLHFFQATKIHRDKSAPACNQSQSWLLHRDTKVKCNYERVFNFIKMSLDSCVSEFPLRGRTYVPNAGKSRAVLPSWWCLYCTTFALPKWMVEDRTW